MKGPKPHPLGGSTFDFKGVYFLTRQSRRFEARRGLAEATPRTQNVLARGQSETNGDSKLEFSKAELEEVGNCAAYSVLEFLIQHLLA